MQVFSCYCVIQMLLLLFSLQHWIFELICIGKLPCFIMHLRCSTKCLRENVARLLSLFNALLGACVSAKKFDKVDGIFRELTGKMGVSPDIVSYNIMTKALCEMERLENTM
ncbi:putative tetratricopeptide-like helical domain superfamily [Helianthus anomalus]